MKLLSIAVIACATGLTGGLLARRDDLASLNASEIPSFAPPESGLTKRIVLVTLDGVRPRDVFLGVDPDLAASSKPPLPTSVSAERLLPNIHSLFFKDGVALGDPRLEGGLSASGSHHVSLPGYLELMTGAPTPCRNNDCMPDLTSTIAEELAGPWEGEAGSSAVFSSWETVERAASSGSGLVSVSAGRKPGDDTPPFPGHGRYRPDSDTATLALDYLTQARPRFLWIALGDTDEWAHMRDYSGYLRALRAADSFLGKLALLLDEMGEDGESTMLLVTTDHGRDSGFADHGGPESAPVWLLARGPGVARSGAVGTRDQRYLRDVAPTIRAGLGMPQRECKGCGQVIEEILQRDASKEAL